ncbi:MAG TPA: GAF and ANTAR domain-containing protein [Actinocatenispora sp.]
MSDLSRILASLRETRRSRNGICDGCLEHLPGMAGVGLTAMTGSSVREPICASDPVSARLERLQYDVGEGPSLDAFDGNDPVLAGDLSAGAFRRRWPVFSTAAVEIGARAVFAFPLQVGAVRIGVLETYRPEPGPLSERETARSLLVCHAAIVVLLDGQMDGALGAGVLPYRAEVHQATGMIVAQLDVSAEEAFVRLRARAYADNRTVEDVARDVVDRRVRFDDEPVV